MSIIECVVSHNNNGAMNSMAEASPFPSSSSLSLPLSNLSSVNVNQTLSLNRNRNRARLFRSSSSPSSIDRACTTSLAVTTSTLHVTNRVLLQTLIPSLDARTLSVLFDIYYHPVVNWMRTLLIVCACVLAILVFARVRFDAVTCSLVLLFSLLSNLPSLLLSNSSLLHRLISSHFEFWFLLSQIVIVTACALYMFSCDARMFAVCGWIVAALHVVILDSSPVPRRRKIGALVSGLLWNISWAACMYFTIVDDHGAWMQYETWQKFGHVISVKDVFATHILTFCALMCRHLYVSVRQAGASVIINTNYDLAHDHCAETLSSPSLSELNVAPRPVLSADATSSASPVSNSNSNSSSLFPVSVASSSTSASASASLPQIQVRVEMNDRLTTNVTTSAAAAAASATVTAVHLAPSPADVNSVSVRELDIITHRSEEGINSNHSSSPLPISRSFSARKPILLVTRRSLIQVICPCISNERARMLHRIYHSRLFSLLRTTSFVIGASLSILVFAHVIVDVISCSLIFTLVLFSQLPSLLLSNSSLLYHLFTRSFEVWFLLSQLLLVTISCAVLVHYDARVLVLMCWLVAAVHVVLMDASPLPAQRKVVALVCAMTANMAWCVLVYMGVTDNQYNYYDNADNNINMNATGVNATSPSYRALSYGQHALFLFDSVTVSADDMFVSHLLTFCALMCRHLYVNVKRPGTSVIISSNYVIMRTTMTTIPVTRME